MCYNSNRIEHLISSDGSRVSRRIFTDEQVYRLELQKIFERSWLYLGHTSQFNKENDYVAAWIGEIPVIVSRDGAGGFQAVINSCSHRGLRVCRNDRGNTKRFVCPYHNWSYAPDGTLITVPQERWCSGKLDKSKLGLARVPKLEIYEGLIFGSLNPDIQSLSNYLGDMCFYLDTYLKRFPAGIEILEPVHKWQLQGNWKLPVENQLGDVAHAPHLHGSLLAGNPANEEIDKYGVNVVPEAGHAIALRLLPESEVKGKYMWGEYADAATDPELKEYLHEVQSYTDEVLGKVRRRIKGLTLGVFPNFSLLWVNNTIRVSHPRGPSKLEMWSWCMVPANAPQSVRNFARNSYSMMFGPGGALEQEDSDAWHDQYRGSSIGVLADRDYYYGLGLGEEGAHAELPGLCGNSYNELYSRQFYLRWHREICSATNTD